MRKYFFIAGILGGSIACTAEPAKEHSNTSLAKEIKVEEIENIEETNNVDSTPLESTLTESSSQETEIVELPEEKEQPSILEEEKIEEESETIIEEVKEQLPEPKKEVVTYSPSHSAFDALLKKYVTSSGKVNYDGFKSEKSKLDEYLALLAKNPPKNSWTNDEKLAYWINLYNAATIQLILKNYPTKSIMKINSGKAWDIKFVKSGEKTLTLNQIENEIIRPTFKDARIHFAVNCAAKSCPKLLNGAFYPHKLQQQLDVATKKFINNSSKNQVSASSIKISKIFEWYAVDFGGKSKLVEYFNNYSDTEINPKAKVSFMEYNWDLNN